MEAVAVFLDSNVLFSLCWKGSENTILGVLLKLQDRGDLRLLISPLVLYEASENLRVKKPEALPLLRRIAESCQEVPDANLPLEVVLPKNDRLILSAAVAGKARYFLTGNTADFGPLYGRTIGGTRVLTPRAFILQES